MREFFMIETSDAFFDVISLALTSAEGDLTFCNDPDGLVQTALLVSVVLSVLMVCVEGGFYRSDHSRVKDFLVHLYFVHMIFEDLFQAFVYTWVAMTQVSRALLPCRL